MTTALIAEDEPLLCAEIREKLLRAWPALTICASVHDGHSALQEFERHQPEVIFLDVQMPGLNGLELARLIGPRAHIVFITAFDHYAVQAFEEGAVDYILKPIDAPRLARATLRIRQRLGQTPSDMSKLIERVAESTKSKPEMLRWISVLHGREIRLIMIEEVCYFRADNKYVAVVTASGESLIAAPLKELLERLDPEVFWQVHRGTIVNLNAIRSISRGLDGRLTLNLKNRQEFLPVGNSYASRFRQM